MVLVKVRVMVMVIVMIMVIGSGIGIIIGIGIRIGKSSNVLSNEVLGYRHVQADSIIILLCDKCCV